MLSVTGLSFNFNSRSCEGATCRKPKSKGQNLNFNSRSCEGAT